MGARAADPSPPPTASCGGCSPGATTTRTASSASTAPPGRRAPGSSAASTRAPPRPTSSWTARNRSDAPPARGRVLRRAPRGRRGDAGLPLRFRFPGGDEIEREDPYRFLPTVGELDLHLIGEGSHRRLWEVLGAHPRTVDGVAGVAFAVWAPNARRVSVVGDFNAWDGRLHPMRTLGGTGVWELFVPGLGEWTIYRYEIAAPDGSLRLKTDPLAFAAELRPKTAGLVFEHGRYPWGDAAWLAERAGGAQRARPLAVYEVHLGSWMRAGGETGEWLTYREVAPRLAEHARRLGFTHVELLPVAEHPFDASWATR